VRRAICRSGDSSAAKVAAAKVILAYGHGSPESVRPEEMPFPSARRRESAREPWVCVGGSRGGPDPSALQNAPQWAARAVPAPVPRALLSRPRCREPC